MLILSLIIFFLQVKQWLDASRKILRNKKNIAAAY